MTIDLKEIQSYRGRSTGQECVERGGHYLIYKAEEPAFGPMPAAYMYDCIGCLATITVEKDQALNYVGIVPDLSRPEITNVVYRIP